MIMIIALVCLALVAGFVIGYVVHRRDYIKGYRAGRVPGTTVASKQLDYMLDSIGVTRLASTEEAARLRR